MLKLAGMARREPPVLSLQGTKSASRVRTALLLVGLVPHGVKSSFPVKKTWGVRTAFKTGGHGTVETPRTKFAWNEVKVAVEICPPIRGAGSTRHFNFVYYKRSMGGSSFAAQPVSNSSQRFFSREHHD